MMQLAIHGSNKPLIWLVQPSYSIGKDEQCDICLRDNALLGVHLRLKVDGDKITLLPEEGATVRIDGAPIQAGHEVKHGDRLILGQSELRIVDPKKIERPQPTPPQPAHTAWSLQGLNSALSTHRYALTSCHVIGRAPECDITLGVAHLSRKHAKVTLDGEGLWVEDLGSANGTFVNGQRIERALLKSGDEVRFDTLRFRVIGPGEEVDPDKTSLRPAIAETPRPRPRTASPQPKPARPTPAPVGRASVSSTATGGEAASGAGAHYLWMVGVALIAAVVLVTWFVLA